MINRNSIKNVSVWICLFLMALGCENKKFELEDRFRKNMGTALN